MKLTNSISSINELAVFMAERARFLARTLLEILEAPTSTLDDERQLLAWLKGLLKRTVSFQEFSDWYAQTLVYGLFAARYHDENDKEFTRQKAAELIPQSNPFLRKLFQRIGVYDLDERIVWIIDDLVGVFGVTDVRQLLDSSKFSEQDPVMLFYEDFLAAYDPARRKAKGVYYTPAPVVEFIVRIVDEILQRDFDLRDGLADRSMVESKSAKPAHRLQILDPATGTGTFLVQVVRKIHEKFAGREGAWNEYVREHLLPRLHGYEILMAPYAMAHLNLEYVFRETGATELGNARYGIYLTNTLEEPIFDGNLFSPIDMEAQAASILKNEKQVMVMLGNPPYNVSSSNKSAWIEQLIFSYKEELREQNIQPLSDDYIKFIRYAQYHIERTEEGIVAFITNNSFLDGIIHRRMREELLRVFDEIYILNLHGNSRLKEKAPDGGKDENVFDIQAGVSINILVKKKGEKQQKARLFYHELYGLRKEKFAALAKFGLKSKDWKRLKPIAPNYFFVDKNFACEKEYRKGFGFSELFYLFNSGASTSRDELIIKYTALEVSQFLTDCKEEAKEKFRTKYNIPHDTRNWNAKSAQSDALKNFPICIEHFYRPYDKRYVAYTGKTRGLWAYPCFQTLGALLHPANYSLCVTRQVSIKRYQHCFVSHLLVNKGALSMGDSAYAFPLYIFPDGWDYTPAEIVAGITKEGKPIELELNMRREILDKVSKSVGETVRGEDVFDYIYGVLNDKEYREKYIEFLKIDYPRIPYPKDKAEYEQFVARGAWLRRLHLMDETLDIPITATFSVSGTNLVEVVKFENGRVWINETQYFGDVPRSVWDHYVGSYQPARLWLQKRIGRVLSFDDIEWYRRVVSTMEVELA